MNDSLLFDSNYLSQLELLRIESRKKFLGSRQGGHLSLKKGHGLEFSDYRQYELGDNPRYIDWKAYGRTDKLFLKQFQEEQDLLISVFLDASASMGMETNPKKWEFAKKLALSFCYIGLIQQDKVGLNILGDNSSIVLSSPQSFPQFVTKIKKAAPSANNNFGQMLKSAALRLKFPGVAIIISDFHTRLEDIDFGFRYLKSRNLDIVAIQIISEKDLNPIPKQESSELIDSETGKTFQLEFGEESAIELESLIQEHTKKLNQYFSQRQIGFTRLYCNNDIINSLRRSQQALRVIK